MHQTMHQNGIMVVKPYKWEGMWVFDDEKTGLLLEPFVAGVPEILEALLEQQGIPVDEAEKGFRLIFSAIPFPGHQLSARRVGEEAGGNWYEESVSKARGWLCPALFRYFDTAPDNLHVRVERSCPCRALLIKTPAGWKQGRSWFLILAASLFLLLVPVSAPHRGDLGPTPPGYDLPPLRGSREEL